MKRFYALSVVLALSLIHSWAGASDPPTQNAEIQRLRERIDSLEGELKTLRREVAALRTALGKSAPQQPRSDKASKKLGIKVLDGDWGGAPNSNIRAVCLSAAEEIWKQFPGQKIEPITVRQSVKGPMVIFGKGDEGERRVLLNVKGTYWAQFAFQFAHEFCHILCNYRAANNPNLWFEESLCETASLFAMRQMAETWKTKPPYSNWKSFAVKLSDYAENRLPSTALPEGMSLADWYRQHEESLRKNGTDRAKNQIVAVALLRLLEKSPQAWPAVRYLNQWDRSESLSLEAYLIDWYRRVPEEHKKFVAEVGKLFEITLD